MTLIDLVRSLGISKATLYRRIKDAGLSLDDIRDENGDVKPEYIQTITALFDTVKTAKSSVSETQEQQQQAASCGEVSETLELRIRLEYATQRIETLEKELADARKERDAWREQAQQAESRFDRLLPAPDQTERRSFWTRLLRK